MNDAINFLLDERGVETILRATRTPNYTEAICEMGGDILTYRVYGNKEDGFTLVEK